EEMARFEGPQQARRVFRPDTDHLCVGTEVLERGADSANQSAAADGYEDGVELRRLLREFHAESALARHDVEIVVRGDIGFSLLGRRAARRELGIEGVAVDDRQLGAEPADGIHLGPY